MVAERNLPDRIVLVGFMAAGKTTVGRILADRLGWELLDFDAEILRRTGRPAGAIIREDGEAVFRAIEAELTSELKDRTRIVLAPGGGWSARPAAAELLGPQTLRVWLRVGAAEAVRRAEREGTDRPLLGPSEGRVERAASLLAAREAAYAEADLVVDAEREQPDAVAGIILRRIGIEAGGR